MKSKVIAYVFVAAFSIFPLAGIGMLIGAFSSYKNTSSFIKEASRAEGTVVDVLLVDMGVNTRRTSSVYKPNIRFINHEGQKVEFISSVGTNPPSYSKGQKVEILYRPTEPQNARINDFDSLWGDSIILAGIGGGFFIIGTIVIIPFAFLVSGLSERKNEYLKKSGVPIQTEFQSVEIDTSLSINGVHPYVVVTQWQNPSTSDLYI